MKLARAAELAKKLEGKSVDEAARKEMRAEIQSYRTPTFRMKPEDAPPGNMGP